MIARVRASIARCRAQGDSGIALITVIGSMMVLTMFATAGLALSVGSMPASRHDQDYAAALTAAQAGVDDYVHHLNNDDSYWQDAHCENPALVGPSPLSQCPAADPGWVPVSPSDPNGPEFHYDIDTSTLAQANNSITVTSTGKVHGVTRTIQVSVSRGGSTQFVYYTDYEDADPTNSVVYPSGPPSNSNCYKHWWEGRSGNDSGCVEINFVSGDVIDGKVHTNDTPLMWGSPTFGDSFEDSDPGCKTASASNDYASCWRANGASSPNFQKPPPKYAIPLELPDNTTDMKKYASCDYVGSTRIRFTGDGNMLVWSQESNVSAACGGANPMGVSVPVPNSGVIYAEAAPSQHQCAGGEIGDGLPVTGDQNMTHSDQYCGQGNLYVEGSVRGRVTLAAENSIVITGDLTLAGGLNGNDMVGLVAGNSVEVMNPVIDYYAASCSAGATDHGVSYVRTPGTWLNAGDPAGPPAAGMVWQGENWTYSGGTWSVTRGGWVTQPYSSGSWWNPPKPELWQAGYWSQDWHGNWSWTSGKWVTKSGNYGDDSDSGWQSGSSGQSWQGESWDPLHHCTGDSTTWPHRATSGQLNIFASIQTLQHSFLVQSYDKGSFQGNLNVYGSIAQRYRGIVGQGGSGGTGYLKNYQYDTRLVYSSPPYFPQWVGATWTAGRSGEISPMYSG